MSSTHRSPCCLQCGTEQLGTHHHPVLGTHHCLPPPGHHPQPPPGPTATPSCGFLTMNGISLDEALPTLAHHHAIQVAIEDEVVPENRVSPMAGVHPAPLVLTDDILWDQAGRTR